MSSYVIPCNDGHDGYMFTSLVNVRRFLDLKPPYDVCQICKRSRDEHHQSKCKTGVPRLLNLLFKSEVPSPEGADLLRRLSRLVVCKWDNCQKEGEHHRLYEAWCDRLWRHYLRAHKLDPEDVEIEGRPTEFTKEEWESAIGEDDSAYYSSNEDSISNPNNPNIPNCDSDDDGPNADSDSDDDNSTSTGGDDVDTETKPFFSKFLKELSHDEHRSRLLDLMMSNISSNKNRCPGHIYGFKRRDCPGYIKIGYIRDETDETDDDGKDESQTTTARTAASTSPKNKNPANNKEKKKGTPRTPRTVETRIAEWRKSCEHEIILVFKARIECHAIQRIESLIHTTLREHRRKQDPPCEPCRKRSNDGQGGQHDEWFEVDEAKAREVVNFWGLFAQLQPYSLGRLTDFWQEDISHQRNAKNFFPKDYPAMSWMRVMTPCIEQLVERKNPDRWKE